MNVSNIIVLSVVLIILLLFTVFLVELFIPINMKYEMNNICRSYLFEIQEDGKLSVDNELKIKSKLEKLGLTNIEIIIIASGTKFGDEIDYIVQCNFNHKILNKFLKREKESIVMKYERKLTIKNITN